MTLKEAYEMMYEEKNSNKSEKEIRKKINSEELKKRYRNLMKKHHPDKLGDTKKSQEINNAYDFLKKYLKENEYELIVDEYRLKFDTARKIHNYEISNKIIKIIKECEDKEKHTVSIEKTYQTIKQTDKKIKELMDSLRKVNEIHLSIRKKLQNEILSKEELENLLKIFANEYYDKLNDEKYKNVMDFWYEEELKAICERFENLKKIKERIISPRINNAKNLYLYIQENISINFVLKIAKEFNKVTDLNEKLLLLKLFQDKVYEQDRLCRKCNQTYTEYKEKSKDINNYEINSKYIKEIEDIFLRLITKEYIGKLENPNELANAKAYNQKYKQKYEEVRTSLETNLNYYKEEILDEIKSKIEEINYIKNLINENRKQYDSKLNKNASIENLVNLNFNIDRELVNYKEKAIKKYYEAFIYHYIEVLNSNAVPEEITSLYKEALNSKENPDMIDKYYKIFKREYNKSYNETNKRLTKAKTARPNDEEIQILKRNIKQRINYYTGNDGNIIFNIPEDKKKSIESKCQNMNNLSVEELYNLYIELDNLFVGRYEEVKFK